MKYTPSIYVVATKNTAVEILSGLGEARQFACAAAMDNPGIDYRVYEWRNSENWRDRPTRYAYRGFQTETREQAAEREAAEQRTAAEWKAVQDREWGRLDSERGHANMQTAHNHMKNYGFAKD